MGFEALAAVALEVGAEEVAATVIADAVTTAAVETAVTDVVGSIVGDTIAAGVADAAAAGGFESFAATAGSVLSSVPAEALTPQLLQQAGFTAPQLAAAQNAGWSLADIGNAVKTGGAALNALSGVIGPVASLGGAKYASNVAGIAAQQQALAAQQAAGILAPAATQAANLQAAAATQSAGTLADAYKGYGGVQAAAATQAGQDLALANKQAADLLSSGYLTSANQQVGGLTQALGTAKDVLAQQTSLQQPYMQAGTQALDTLTKGLMPGGQFNRGFTMADAQNMPAYQFALEQGTEAINAAAARGGTQLSSSNLSSLTKFAEGTAAQYQQQAFNQWLAQNNLTLGGLQNMVRTGQISTDQVQNALQQYGVSAETIQQNIGTAQAAGTLGAAKASSLGVAGAAQDLAKYNTLAAGYTGAGILGAGQAQAAGQAGAAGYTASGIANEASARAAGLMGTQNAVSTGTVAQGNIMAKGLSDAGKQILTSAAAPSTTGAPPTGTLPNVSAPIPMGAQSMVGGAAIDPSLPSLPVPTPVPVAPSYNFIDNSFRDLSSYV